MPGARGDADDDDVAAQRRRRHVHGQRIPLRLERGVPLVGGGLRVRAILAPEAELAGVVVAPSENCALCGERQRVPLPRGDGDDVDGRVPSLRLAVFVPPEAPQAASVLPVVLPHQHLLVLLPVLPLRGRPRSGGDDVRPTAVRHPGRDVPGDLPQASFVLLVDVRVVEVVLGLPPHVKPPASVGGDAEAVPSRRDVHLADAEDGAMLVVAGGVPGAPAKVPRVVAQLIEHIAVQVSALVPARALALVRDGHPPAGSCGPSPTWICRSRKSRTSCRLGR